MASTASHLSQENILRDVHDPVTQTLRTSATATIGTVNVDVDYGSDSVAVGDPVTNNLLKINANGSIDANVVLSHTGDSVSIGDGVDILGINADGSINAVVSGQILTDLLTELQQKTEPSDAQNIRAISSTTDTITVKSGSNVLGINADGSVNVAGSILTNILTELQQKTEPSDAQSIRPLTSGVDSVTVPGILTDAQLRASPVGVTDTVLTGVLGPHAKASSLSVTIATDQGDINAEARLVGTIDGQANGTKYGIVNNIRQQIMSAHDRHATLTYADFGTKDQRVTEIVYTSATFPGTNVHKQFSYTLISGKYRRDNINWVIT